MVKEKKVAVVFGGSRGIGFAVSCKLMEEGCFVFVVCSSKNNVEKTKNSFNERIGNTQQCCVLFADVRREEEVAVTAKHVTESYGYVNYLVNCAGIMEPEAVDSEHEKMENWDAVMSTNLRGTFLACKYMIPLLKNAQDAHIINISGGLGLLSGGMVGGTLPAYRISKAAVNALSLNLSEELKANEIMVNSVDPGWVKTDMGGSNAPKMAREVAEEIYQLLLSSFDKGNTGKLYKENIIIGY